MSHQPKWHEGQFDRGRDTNELGRSPGYDACQHGDAKPTLCGEIIKGEAIGRERRAILSNKLIHPYGGLESRQHTRHTNESMRVKFRIVLGHASLFNVMT